MGGGIPEGDYLVVLVIYVYNAVQVVILCEKVLKPLFTYQTEIILFFSAID